MHQLGPLVITDPERRATALAVMPVGRTSMTVDGRVPHSERTFAFHFKRVGDPHDIDRISTAAGAFATDRAIAALIRVGRMALDAEADRTATTTLRDASAFKPPHRPDRRIPGFDWIARRL